MNRLLAIRVLEVVRNTLETSPDDSISYYLAQIVDGYVGNVIALLNEGDDTGAAIQLRKAYEAIDVLLLCIPFEGYLYSIVHAAREALASVHVHLSRGDFDQPPEELEEVPF